MQFGKGMFTKVYPQEAVMGGRMFVSAGKLTVGLLSMAERFANSECLKSDFDLKVKNEIFLQRVADPSIGHYLLSPITTSIPYQTLSQLCMEQSGLVPLSTDTVLGILNNYKEKDPDSLYGEKEFSRGFLNKKIFGDVDLTDQSERGRTRAAAYQKLTKNMAYLVDPVFGTPENEYMPEVYEVDKTSQQMKALAVVMVQCAPFNSPPSDEGDEGQRLLEEDPSNLRIYCALFYWNYQVGAWRSGVLYDLRRTVMAQTDRQTGNTEDKEYFYFQKMSHFSEKTWADCNSSNTLFVFGDKESSKYKAGVAGPLENALLHPTTLATPLSAKLVESMQNSLSLALVNNTLYEHYSCREDMAVGVDLLKRFVFGLERAAMEKKARSNYDVSKKSVQEGIAEAVRTGALQKVMNSTFFKRANIGGEILQQAQHALAMEEEKLSKMPEERKVKVETLAQKEYEKRRNLQRGAEQSDEVIDLSSNSSDELEEQQVIITTSTKKKRDEKRKTKKGGGGGHEEEDEDYEEEDEPRKRKLPGGTRQSELNFSQETAAAKKKAVGKKEHQSNAAVLRQIGAAKK